ncbi:MAG: putative selenate reductase subunit YgfK [Velocimicrobium sp.]
MGDRMTPIPFKELMTWIQTEKKESGKVFGIRKPYVKKGNKTLPIFTEKLEMPFGPAAGPHTQLAQNIVASYYAGSRFFELKTVQTLDGEDLPVAKPCIIADDECYNCEWSTELYVKEALDEYVKGWFACKVLAKEYNLSDPDGFVFNMSVGYNLEGIQSEKIDCFIEGLKNAEHTKIFKECKEYLLSHLDEYEHVDKAFVEGISSNICTSVTLSTLHGCPPEEIERIATYLLTEKKLNTYIKCNPTLLGYDEARSIMDKMGYDYVVFGDFHFKDDLQFEDAVPMIQRLLDLASTKGLEFGAKITNTFPVDVTRNELPSEEMYMSGRSLYALSMNVARKLTESFQGKLRISYSGGADYFNIEKIYEAGIWPITMATTMLKPGGYQRLTQIAEIFDKVEFKPFEGVDLEAVELLCEEVLTDEHHLKAIKPLPIRKMEKHVPLLDCFVAPCSDGCPIHQDIPQYIKLVGEEKYEEALRVITDKNPLPFITGTICSHRCMNNCTRNFYEESVQIRAVKLVAAEYGYDTVLKELKPEAALNKKVAIVGGGPAGMAAAFFLARGGASVTLYEKRESLGGVVRHIIPEFRISAEAIEKDVSLLKQLGVDIRVNTEIASLQALKAEGFEDIILAVGATKPGSVHLESGESMNGLAFLEACKRDVEQLKIGEHVAVIGGGNTAMDVARAAKRVPGVKHVYLVYRRDKRNMPADAEELELAIEDGVEFKELLAPVALSGTTLTCDVMKLGAPDLSGRRSPEKTGEKMELLVDTVIAAVGEKIDDSLYITSGLTVDERGRVATNTMTLESNLANVYVIGDGLNGPATVVEAIRDATLACNAILGMEPRAEIKVDTDVMATEAKKGILAHVVEAKKETERCLECNHVCECCVDVCPNRANVAIKVKGKSMMQIIHVDKMCNECGNCMSFCPFDSAPYKDKFTLFATPSDFENSTNAGFLLLDENKVTVRVRLLENVNEYSLLDADCGLDAGLKELILAVFHQYRYMF